jgi:hypothetical protein
MLFLRTGLPGAGKTLNAIREIDMEHAVDPENPKVRLHKDPSDPELPPRTIYYFGIPELNADKLKSKWVEFETPDEWFNLPDGSVIVIDESQRIFGTDLGRQRPEKVARFETHRHQGLDIHLITQHPSLLTPAVRKLVGKHINFIRPYGREKGIFRHEYEFCIDSPEKRSNFKQAQEQKVALDPAYFGTYKSSTVHTHKPQKPNYLAKVIPLVILIVVCLGSLPILGYWKITEAKQEAQEFKRKHDAEKALEEGANPSSTAPGSSVQPAPGARKPSGSQRVETVDDLVKENTPRIESIPATAPRYDNLNKPKDFPRLVCASSYDPGLIAAARERHRAVDKDDRGREFTCTCYSQQVTRVETSARFCLNVVENGMFDDTKVPPTYGTITGKPATSSGPASSDLGFETAAIQRGRAANSPLSTSGSTLTIIPDSSR